MTRVLIALLAVFLLSQPARAAVIQYNYYGQQMVGSWDAEGRTFPGLRIRLDLDMSRLGLTSLAGQTLNFPDPGEWFPSGGAFFRSMGYLLTINHIYFPNDMINEFSVRFDEAETIVAWNLEVIADCSPQDCWLFAGTGSGREILSVWGDGPLFGEQRTFLYTSSQLGSWQRVVPVPLPAPMLLLASALLGLFGLPTARRLRKMA
jgi:hypothetical protein